MFSKTSLDLSKSGLVFFYVYLLHIEVFKMVEYRCIEGSYLIRMYAKSTDQIQN